MAKGLMEAEEIGDRIKVAKAERNLLQVELAAEQPVENVVTLHPAAVKHYVKQLKYLQGVYEEGLAAGDEEANQALRALVHTITVSRDENQPDLIKVDVKGHLNALLDTAKPLKSLSVDLMVAKARFELSPH